MRGPKILATGAVLAIAACMLVPQGSEPGIVHTFLVVGVSLILVLVGAIFWEAFRHQRLTSSIARLAYPASLCGRSVAFVPGLGSAVVAGLHHPRIFCAEDLPRRLDQAELRAVILHEHHHQLVRAPLRLIAINAVAPLLGQIEAGRAWVERARARLEIAADAYALASGASRPALASALIKLSSSPGSIMVPGFSSASDLRLRALLDETPASDGYDPIAVNMVAALIVVASCLAVYLG